MYVLLVDDMPLIGRMIDREITELGYKLIMVTNVSDAMVQLAAYGPHIECILLDWHLPGMNGIDWLRHIKGIENYAKIPVVMLTSNSTKQHIVAAFASGCEQYLIKPFNMDDLKAKVGEVINNRRRKKQIMIVDDSNVVLLMLKQMLKKQGYEVCAIARNGVEAIQMYSETRPDLVFMDVNMPEMDGLTAVKGMKEVQKNVRIILISGQITPEREAEAESLGVRAFLKKPFDEQMIYGALVDALG